MRRVSAGLRRIRTLNGSLNPSPADFHFTNEMNTIKLLRDDPKTCFVLLISLTRQSFPS